MGSVRKHWPSILGGLDLAYHLLRALADSIGLVDTAVSHIPGRDQTWLGQLEMLLLNPPGWVVFVTIVTGLLLILWDFRRNPRVVHHQGTTVQLAGIESRAQAGNLDGRASPSNPPPSSMLTLVPDWSIRELVRYIKPDVLNTKIQDEFEAVQDEILDKLSIGQIAAWGRVVATHKSPLTPIPTDYWRHAKLNIWLLDGNEDGGNVLQAEPRSNRENLPQYREIWVNRAQSIAVWPGTPKSSNKKISVQDAMMYIIDRKWPGPTDKLPELAPAFNAINDIRMAAAAEKMTVFGIEYNGQISAAIDSTFWINHQIALETVFQPNSESIKTESAISLAAEKRYKHLQVLKAEVEALWPPV